MSLEAIEACLNEATGLDAHTIGTQAVERALRRRMRELGIRDETAYSALLCSSEDERSALTEEIVIPETWFFRNEDAFKLLQRFVVQEWRAARAHETLLRILSIPCSTGEEPYSIAMALLDAGLKADEFRIDAVDISRRALARAERASYGSNAFRGDAATFRERYFKSTPTGFELGKRVRQCVHFHHGNILEQDLELPFGSYDIIFCRNLLIYFDTISRRRTAKALARMLSDDGLLFVGHAEMGPVWRGLFVSGRYPMAFAYRKFNDDRRLPRPARPLRQESRARVRERRLAPSVVPRKDAAAPSGPAVSTAAAAPGDADAAASLQTATELADQGRLREAFSLCEASLRQSGASAPAYYLLGLISNHRGQKAAAKGHLRKALYLEPNHYEALVHLGLLLREQGDYQAAEQLMNRAERVVGQQAALCDVGR